MVPIFENGPADLHAILPGGQVKKPEQRRQRPWAVYHQDHLGSPWDPVQHGEYGGWSAAYGYLPEGSNVGAVLCLCAIWRQGNLSLRLFEKQHWFGINIFDIEREIL